MSEPDKIGSAMMDNDIAFHLAIGCRDTLRDWVEVMRSKLHSEDDTLDRLVDDLDRIADDLEAIHKRIAGLP